MRAAECRDKRNITKRELGGVPVLCWGSLVDHTTSSTDDHTARLCRALICTGFFVFILSHPRKNEPRKQISASRNRKFACSRSRTSRKRGRKRCGPKAAAFGNCSARRSLMTVGAFCLAKFLHLGRISARPRWGSMAKTFAIPSCLNFRRSQGERQELSAFTKATSEQLP